MRINVTNANRPLFQTDDVTRVALAIRMVLGALLVLAIVLKYMWLYNYL